MTEHFVPKLYPSSGNGAFLVLFATNEINNLRLLNTPQKLDLDELHHKINNLQVPNITFMFQNVPIGDRLEQLWSFLQLSCPCRPSGCSTTALRCVSLTT